ncbi:hypothetical protein H4S07_002258 [Coemansia furcata]|uniref:Uncharacterized protein n=1 Tax=Coemansia furcata TaxID=417177 RepID=A0ACC1LM55_9FUNG|nr:hypothetical protein H4S07_002258 [Coemansia furcata]
MSGGQGLTPVGSPNRRTQRRSLAPAQTAGLESPPFPRISSKPNTKTDSSSDNSRSSFVERVYRNTGGAAEVQQVLAESSSAAKPLPETDIRRAPQPPAPSSVTVTKGPTSAIPATVLDIPSQRLYALSLVGLLAAWKIYEAIGLSFESGQTSLYLFIKWTILDCALLYGGWRLHIPKLRITTAMFYGLLAGCVFVNLNMFLLSSSVLVLALKPVGLGVASSCMRSIKSVPLVGPWLVGDSELLIDTFKLDDEHILGRHTIHILPHSMAHMNPAGKNLCIDLGVAGQRAWYSRLVPGSSHKHQERQLTIPMLINGTRPASIMYAHTSFETGVRQVRSVKNINGLRMETVTSYPILGNWVLATYYLPVVEEGAYEIHSVRDSRGLEFRTMAGAQATVVVGCPTAHLKWWQQGDDGDSTFAVGSDGHASICQRISSSFSDNPVGLLDVVVEGFTPMDVSVVRLVNGHREAIELDGIVEKESESEDDDENQWARFKRRKLTYPLSDAVLQSGEYVYRLESVRDAANHTAILSDTASGASAIMARMVVHARPRVAWASGLPSSSSLWLSDDRQRASHHVLGLQLVGQAPWTVDYTIDTGAEVLQESRTFTTAVAAALDARQAGMYSLVGVRDSHCAGATIVDAGQVTVERAVRPTANISSTPIMARECGGEIGAHVSLELTGRPPFAVHYRERNLLNSQGRTAVRVVRTHQHRHVLAVTPEVAGTYELEFFRVDDDNFPSGQSMSKVVRQVVHAQPSATIQTLRMPSTVCRGDSVKVPVHLSGEAPWQLSYALAHADYQATYNITDIEEERHSIAVGPLDDPGEHAVDLVRVTDARGCARELAGSSATIRVRASGPHATFRCDYDGVRLREGDADARIPVTLSAAAEFPVELAYSRLDDDTVFHATINRASSPMSVPAHGAGVYVLVSVKDTCPGTVDTAPCTVHVEPRPRAWFTTDNLTKNESRWLLPSTCEGASAETAAGLLALGLSGAGPWRVEYFVDYWADATAQSGSAPDRSSLRSALVLDPAVLPTEGRAPGRYRYRLSTVSDERYTRPQPIATLDDVLAVEHTVTRSPVAVLRAYSKAGKPLVDVGKSGGLFGRQSRSQSVTHCLAPGQQAPSSDESAAWARARDDLPEFRIEFAPGHPPFDAWVEVLPAAGKTEVIEVLAIPGHSHPVVLPDHIASRIGRYHLRLLRTRDAFGCEHRYTSDGPVDLIGGGIDIEYIEAPTVRPASSSPASRPARSVCIGDILAFDLRGLGPWSIDYLYNGARRSTTASKRLFRRIADVPGNFTLTRVCHRAATNDCCSEFDDLSYAVHDIPRVRVGRGVDVHQDILEGDLVHIPLYLTGRPPFTFTWQRRALSDSTGSAKSKVLESHTVKDLDAYEYTITTSSEGTFEVTFVQDQYCQYPKA